MPLKMDDGMMSLLDAGYGYLDEVMIFVLFILSIGSFFLVTCDCFFFFLGGGGVRGVIPKSTSREMNLTLKDIKT